MNKLVAAIGLTATSLLASARTPDTLCGQVLAADLTSVGARDTGDKGMAGVALKAPGQAACFVTRPVKRQGVSVEGGSAQCLGFKGRVLVQMSVDDGVHQQDALAARVKQAVESVLSRL